MFRAALAALLLSAAPALAEIGIHDPYAISPVPGAPTGAVYMLIHNHGGADRLLSVSTPVTDHAELHVTEEEEGVMRMRPVEGGLEVPAGGVLLLDRGGPHVMLMGLETPLEDGGTIPVTLTFETAGEITVDVPVDFARLTGDAGHGAAAEGHEGH